MSFFSSSHPARIMASCTSAPWTISRHAFHGTVGTHSAVHARVMRSLWGGGRRGLGRIIIIITPNAHNNPRAGMPQYRRPSASSSSGKRRFGLSSGLAVLHTRGKGALSGGGWCNDQQQQQRQWRVVQWPAAAAADAVAAAAGGREVGRRVVQ